MSAHLNLDSEKHLVKLENSYANQYFDQIPEILGYLTYIKQSKHKETGEILYERKRLSSDAKQLFIHTKRTEGKKGCWKSQKTLANELNISEGKINKCKKELTQAFEQLDGQPLISIKVKTKPFIDEDGNHKYSCKYHCMTTTDIWEYNNTKMPLLRINGYPKQVKLSKKEAEIAIEKIRQGYEQNIVCNPPTKSHYDSVPPTKSQCDRPSQGAQSRGDRKHISHIPYVKNTYPTDSAFAEPELNALSNDMLRCFSSENSTYQFLMDYGIGQGMAKKMINEKGISKIQQAYEYMNTQKNIRDKKAYFVKTIFSGYSRIQYD